MGRGSGLGLAAVAAVVVVGLLAVEPEQPHQNVIVADRQRREVVDLVQRGEHGHRLDVQGLDRRAALRPGVRRELEDCFGGDPRVAEHRPPRRAVNRDEEVDVVGVDHGRVGRLAVLLPHRAAVEALEEEEPIGQRGEPAEPDEGVVGVAVAELADHVRAQLLLRLDEVAVEQVDERVALSRVECVTPQLHDVAAGLGHAGSLPAALGAPKPQNPTL